MFPNFRSLQDKRNKRQQLLQQIEREQELERIKNEAYALTDWTSDQAKMMAVSQIPSTATASTQTNTNTMSGSTQTDNNTSSGITQTNDSMAYTNAGAQTNDSMSQANATTQTNTSALVSTTAQTDESGDVKQPIVEPRIKVEPGIHDEQAAAKDEIEYIYGKLPQLTGKKISPLKSNGMPDKDTFFGAEGKIYNRRTGKPSRKADFSFDFSQTLSYLKNLQDQLDIKDEPMEQANRDTSTNLADGAIEAEAKDLLKQILQTNDLSRFKVVPIGKLKHPKTNEYWEYPNYHVDKDLNIVADSFGRKNYNSITSKISWAHTLSHFVSILKKNNVSFKQSNLFTGVKNKWDSPLALNDLSASLNNANNKASQHNGATYLKDRVIQLYNDNDWLVDYNLHPVALPRGDSKAFREAGYILGEYAKIYRVDKNGNIKDISEKSSNTLDKKVDWAATYDMMCATLLSSCRLSCQLIRRGRNSRVENKSSSCHLGASKRTLNSADRTADSSTGRNRRPTQERRGRDLERGSDSASRMHRAHACDNDTKRGHGSGYQRSCSQSHSAHSACANEQTVKESHALLLSLFFRKWCPLGDDRIPIVSYKT